MSMKLLADENISRYLVNLFRSNGYDVFWIREFKRGISDLEVIELARKMERIILTSDKDFGCLVLKEHHDCRGVVLLRLEDEKSSGNSVVNCFNKYQDKLEGHFTIITDRKIRFRVMKKVWCE